MFDNQTIIGYHGCEEDVMNHSKRIVNIGIMIGLLIIASQISFRIGPIPITMQTMMIMIIATMLNPRDSITVGLIYLLMGAIGLPVFASFGGGLAYLLGPTGGFLISFPIILGVMSYIMSYNDGLAFKIIAYFIGTVICYLIGVEYFMVVTNYSLTDSINLCVVPFVLGDLLKIVGAVISTKKLRQINFVMTRN